MKYAVYFNQPGCLPDGDACMEVFDSVSEAARFIFNQRQDIRAELVGRDLDAGYAIGARNIADDWQADDPTPGSLYRWTIEEFEEVEA